MSKIKLLFLILPLLNVSCNGRFDPMEYDPWGGDGQDSSQSTDTPASTDPTNSGVIIEDAASSEDNVDNTQFDATLTVTYNDSGVTVNGSVEGVDIQRNGARLTITNKGDKKVKYILSGSCSDGFFKLYSSKKQAIELNGLTLTNTKGAAINNQSKKRTFIIIKGENKFSDGSTNSSGDYPEETAEEDMKAAIFSEGQLIFSGSGNLNVTAVGKSAITSDDYIRFMEGCNVTVNSAKGHGVRGKDAIIVSGGTINVTLQSTATGKKCFTTDSLMYMGGGNVSLENNASAGTVDSELTGAAGIKADKLFVIQGGSLTINSNGKGCKCINGDGKGYFEGGTVIVKAKGANYGSNRGYGSDSNNSVSSKAIKFDGNLELLNSNIVATSSSHEAIESKGTIYISGGTISASAGDDAINSASTMTISDGVVYAYSSGNDGLDANGNLIIKGGSVYAIGCGSPEVGIDANTEKGYKLYITGGYVIAIGGIENNSSVSQPVISTSWSKNTVLSLCDGDTNIYAFRTPSSGGTTLFMTAPALIKDSKYNLKKSSTISEATSYFDGYLMMGGTSTGGTSSSITASTYSSNGGFSGGGHGGWGW